MEPVYENMSAAAPQADRHYANIHFPQYQVNVLYSSSKYSLPNRQPNEEEEDDEEDDVKYTNVNVDRVRSASRWAFSHIFTAVQESAG